jgi:predicted nucleotidyltransferase
VIEGEAMLETLLSSRVRARILTAIFLSPGIERNAWELAKSLSENYSAVWKELNRLEGIGILVSEQKGNAKAYRVNPTCPIEPELRSIVMKTEGVSGLLKEKLSTMENVKKAFIYGSVASGKADRYSDIDLMVIGEINLEELSSLVSEAEKELNRPVNYVIFSEQEWQDKLAKDEPFAVNVENSTKILLVGGEDAV